MIDHLIDPNLKVPVVVDYNTKVTLTVKSVEGRAVVDGEFEI